MKRGTEAGQRARYPALSRPIRRGLHRITEVPASTGNRARLLIDGPETFEAMLAQIEAAQHRVHLENYIFRGDSIGRRFAEALAERANDGVEVRVIYDWIGSLSTPRAFWGELRRTGVEVLPFAPPSPHRPLTILRRDHRKLLVTDSRFAVVGGLCIGDEWSGTESTAPWRDTAIEVEGPVAKQLDKTFYTLWRRGGGAPYDPLPNEPFEVGDVVIRIIDGPPFHARAYRLYQLITALAEETLFITGAYPLLPTPLRSALAAAARMGVDVRLLAPGRSDLALLNHAARAHYTRLLRAGVRIYEWKGPMLHAKTLSVDGKLAIIGSSNLNPYSFLSTYELDLVLEDQVIASALEYQFLDDLESAREIELEEWKRRPLSQRIRERVGTLVHWLPHRLFN